MHPFPSAYHPDHHSIEFYHLHCKHFYGHYTLTLQQTQISPHKPALITPCGRLYDQNTHSTKSKYLHPTKHNHVISTHPSADPISYHKVCILISISLPAQSTQAMVDTGCKLEAQLRKLPNL